MSSTFEETETDVVPQDLELHSVGNVSSLAIILTPTAETATLHQVSLQPGRRNLLSPACIPGPVLRGVVINLPNIARFWFVVQLYRFHRVSLMNAQAAHRTIKNHSHNAPHIPRTAKRLPRIFSLYLWGDTCSPMSECMLSA